MNRAGAHLPPLNALRAFEAAARRQSFTDAATELHVTPAAISHQVRALEADLGVPLFHRRNRTVELTESGRILLPGLSQAFARVHEAVGQLRAHNDVGVLTVSTPPSLTAKWLVLRLHRFRDRHPEIDVRISATMELADFGRGDADLGIRYGAGHYPGLHAERLLEDQVFPVCSPVLLDGAPPLEAPADLRAHALIHDDAADRNPLAPTWAMWLKAAGVDGVDTNRGLRFSGTHLALDAAVAGRGVALANAVLAVADIAAGRLVRPFGLGLPDRFAYYLVCLPGALERPKVRAFCQWLREEAAESTAARA
jgi:LysR family transcriptional regulator, glycine cleavage system transcriptional activator